MVARFVRGKRGAAAVEFAIVGPLFVVIMAGIFQFGLLFYQQAQMGHVARNASRLLSVAAMSTGDADSYVESQLPDWGDDDPYTTTVVNAAGSFTVTISLPMANITFFPMFESMFGTDLTASAAMSAEDA